LARSERARNEAWEASEKDKLSCEKKMNELRKVRTQLQDQLDTMNSKFEEMEHQV